MSSFSLDRYRFVSNIVYVGIMCREARRAPIVDLKYFNLVVYSFIKFGLCMHLLLGCIISFGTLVLACSIGVFWKREYVAITQWSLDRAGVKQDSNWKGHDWVLCKFC